MGSGPVGNDDYYKKERGPQRGPQRQYRGRLGELGALDLKEAVRASERPGRNFDRARKARRASEAGAGAGAVRALVVFGYST